ncbi:unnamed protein product [Didymodactylos carnosus]|uniref:Uncharacterized protein n=1 Tax=Didymodactylos carnosus TaxID=1234261 RepID=A0A815SU88_9BILA|nr:unnamed protein product [Didymodactylos carnosus]CAF4358797.1 unnamed protein product [Didymodactylos carnosus]
MWVDEGQYVGIGFGPHAGTSYSVSRYMYMIHRPNLSFYITNTYPARFATKVPQGATFKFTIRSLLPAVTTVSPPVTVITVHFLPLSKSHDFLSPKHAVVYFYLFTHIKIFEAINRLTNIRNKQLKLFEDLTMFEQRFLSLKLPKSFDCIKAGIDQEQCVNKRNKIIQELKRRMLNVELVQYEMNIQHYEHLYQQDLTACQLEILIHVNSSLITSIKKKFLKEKKKMSIDIFSH